MQTPQQIAAGLNADMLFPSDNPYGIPTLAAAQPEDAPRRLVEYRNTAPSDGLHFFVDDYRLTNLWLRPLSVFGIVRRYRAVLTPDFSLYRDWPQALHIFNTYRNRWCGAFWQSQGITVIPSVSWAGPESYAFCFAGIARGSVVAVSTVGVRTPEARALFDAGFDALMTQIAPVLVLSYGECWRRDVAIRTYPTYWDEKRPALRGTHTESEAT